MDFKELRKRAKLKPKISSLRLGLKPQTLYKIEAAIRQPSNKVMLKMIDVYGCTSAEVMDAYKTNIERAEKKYGKANA